MNPYEAPQSVDNAVKVKPPRRKLSWGQIALIAAAVGVSQFVLHYFRAHSRNQQQPNPPPQAQPAFPGNP